MNIITLYVRLLDEGTDVTRPTQAEELTGGYFRVLSSPDYDPEDEHWEFPPGSIVRAESRELRDDEFLLAVEGADTKTKR
jgi:hypothetical protein